jgi:hypothetical protein
MSAKPRQDVDRDRERLQRLGLGRAVEAPPEPEPLWRLVKEEKVPQTFLDGLRDVEMSAREERRIRAIVSNVLIGPTPADLASQSSIEPPRSKPWPPTAEPLQPRAC